MGILTVQDNTRTVCYGYFNRAGQHLHGTLCYVAPVFFLQNDAERYAVGIFAPCFLQDSNRTAVFLSLLPGNTYTPCYGYPSFIRHAMGTPPYSILWVPPSYAVLWVPPLFGTCVCVCVCVCACACVCVCVYVCMWVPPAYTMLLVPPPHAMGTPPTPHTMGTPPPTCLLQVNTRTALCESFLPPSCWATLAR